MEPVGWTLLSNHGHVLVCLAMDPDLRMREVATRVGITERAVQQIVRDLTEAGLVRIEKAGRRNHYVVDTTATFRHPLEAHVRISRFTDLVRDGRPDQDASSP
jgi:predicted transcriptional regulator